MESLAAQSCVPTELSISTGQHVLNMCVRWQRPDWERGWGASYLRYFSFFSFSIPAAHWWSRWSPVPPEVQSSNIGSEPFNMFVNSPVDK